MAKIIGEGDPMDMSELNPDDEFLAASARAKAQIKETNEAIAAEVERRGKPMGEALAEAFRLAQRQDDE